MPQQRRLKSRSDESVPLSGGEMGLWAAQLGRMSLLRIKRKKAFAKQGRGRGCQVGRSSVHLHPKFEELEESVPAGVDGGKEQAKSHDVGSQRYLC